MPLVERITQGNSIILIWRTIESENEFGVLVEQSDILSLEGILSSSRRLERLAWRAALRTELPGVEVMYDEYGAPYIDKERYLSVSHCRGAAVVVISDNRCGVDIENRGRNVSSLCGRFVSAEEKLLDTENDPLFEISVWCAKEAMYKYYREKKLDFLMDIRLSSIDMAKGIIIGSVRDELLTVRALLFDDYMVSYILE